MDRALTDPLVARRFRSGRPCLDFVHTGRSGAGVADELLQDPPSLESLLAHVLGLPGVRAQPADVARARRAHASRPGVIGDQVLGWVLTRAGRCAEGDRYATRSLRLGTRDALMLFQAGMAASCAGRTEVARRRLSAALALNPAFSVRWAPVARSELAKVSS